MQFGRLARLGLDAVLGTTLAEEGWSASRKIAKQLHGGDVHTVLNPARVHYAPELERTVRELQGMPCIDLDEAPQSKK